MKRLIYILVLALIPTIGFSQEKSYQDQYEQSKVDHKIVKTVESITINLRTQQTRRHGLRISNEFTISHTGGDAYNIYLEQALENLEAKIRAEVLRISREKKAELKPLALQEAKENVVKLETEKDG